MSEPTQATHQKAFQINVDATKYGTFAEIGGGQEVARWFFRVGGASGTVAKTMSAYDMAVSDAIYGPTPRYVSRQRLQAMLDHEFKLLLERLDEQRGGQRAFFVFANTAATRSFSRQEEGHGWMGVRFQAAPREDASEILIHVRLLDADNWHQQETLGVLGVNLLHGAFYKHTDPEALVASLMDELTPARAEIDMVCFSGPRFARVNNRLMSLRLVERGLCPAAMFAPDGGVADPAEVLRKKPVLIERGSFRPVTLTTLEMLQRAHDQFQRDPKLDGESPVVLAEVTLRSLRGEVEPHRDFLSRVDILGALGQTVLLSNLGAYHRVVAYLSRHTHKPVGIALGIPSLWNLLEKESYSDLEGGLMESLARLFKRDAKLLVHPWRNPDTGEVVTAETLQAAPSLRHLYAHLLENGFIEGIRDCNPALLPIFPAGVRAKLAAGDPAWEAMVPPQAAAIIKRDRLFGLKA